MYYAPYLNFIQNIIPPYNIIYIRSCGTKYQVFPEMVSILVFCFHEYIWTKSRNIVFVGKNKIVAKKHSAALQSDKNILTPKKP